MNVNMTGFPIISEGVYDFCNYSNQYMFSCTTISNKVVLIYADIIQTNTQIIESSSFSFSSLSKLKLSNCYLSPDFLSNVYVESITLTLCNVVKIDSPISQTYLSIVHPPSFQGEFKFSYLNKFGILEIVPNTSIGEISVTYVNDLKSVLDIDFLSLVANSIPSFTNVNVKELNLYLTDYFSYINNDVSNLATMTKVQKFAFINNSTIDFPISIFNIQNSIMTSLSIGGMINKPTQMIELPENNNITELRFGYTFGEFSINGMIPFLSLPNIKKFEINGGNFPNEKDLNKFSNVDELKILYSNLNVKLPKNNFSILDLSNNMISGTVDSSYCTMNSMSLDLKFNNLSGTLPSCFSCYPSSSRNIFLFNSNLKYDPTCSTIKVNIYIDRVNKKLIMWGNDIGLNSQDFYTVPFFSWEPTIPSYRFESSYYFNELLPSNGIFTIYFSSIKEIVKTVNATQSQLPPKCYRECNIGEYCDTNSLKCVCAVGWSGDDCSINTNIYVSSIDSVNEMGGDITLYGWFSNSHNNLIVSIDNQNCPLIQNTITNVSIQCTIWPGTGKKSLSIQQNGVSWSGYFIYETSVKSCLNNCSKNGDCIVNTGECNCRSGYTGFDCSIISGGGGGNGNGGVPSSNTTIDNNGTTVINNQKTSYQILITKLIEFDVDKNVIKEYTLDNKWVTEMKNTDDNNSNNIYQFSQTLVQSLTNCTVSYTVEEIKEKSKHYSFAGYNLTLDSGSIKISVSINNYQYNSFLNNLQLQFQSSVTSDNNDCNQQDTDIQNSNNELLNYITIKKDSKIMQARFLNRILSDGRSSIITSELVTKSSDSVIVGLNLPYCTNCIIDPDFSVLVTTSFKNDCGESERPAYLIPVVVVSGVLGVALVIALSFYIYKKKFVENQLSKKLKKIGTQGS
ncbi:hypothetical protein ACTFIT_001180 [Dictyostelium discoideum]